MGREREEGGIEGEWGKERGRKTERSRGSETERERDRARETE